MKFPKFLIGLFSLLLCISVSEINAQNCTKSKSHCTRNRTEKATKQSKTSYQHAINQSKTSANKQCPYLKKYSSHCTRAKTCTRAKSTAPDKSVFTKKNFIGALVGAATLLDSDQMAFSTGVAYERLLNSRIGLGISSEITLSKNLNVMLGLPFSFHPSKRIKLMASPLASFQQSTTTERTVAIASDEVVAIKDWNNYLGGRLGVAYYLTNKFLKIAPTVRADFINGQVRMNYGVTAGFGF